MKSVETRCCAELVDAARTRPSKFHAGSRGTRQPTDNTLATRLRDMDIGELTLDRLFLMVSPAVFNTLEGHLSNFLIAMNRSVGWPALPPVRSANANAGVFPGLRTFRTRRERGGAWGLGRATVPRFA